MGSIGSWATGAASVGEPLTVVASGVAVRSGLSGASVMTGPSVTDSMVGLLGAVSPFPHARASAKTNSIEAWRTQREVRRKNRAIMALGTSFIRAECEGEQGEVIGVGA